MSDKKDYSSDTKLTARYARALGHPVRVFILEKLCEQSCCYSGDMAEEIPIARSTLSQHLKELKKSGLIEGEIEPPRIRYCIHRKNWEKAQELLGALLKKQPPCCG
jgi:DNA-binding transcriptional ArsR family regulator